MLGKFARVALRTRTSTTTAASAWRRGRRRRTAAFGIDRGLPFPIDATCRGAEVILLVGANPAETMPPLMQYFDEQQRARRAADRRRPAPHRDRRRRALHLQLHARHRRALANGLLHVAIREG